MKQLIPLIFCSIITFSSCNKAAKDDHPVNYNVHTFYYAWYGNPEVDGKYNNWNHPIVPHWIDSSWNNAGNYPGGDDIGANYYPELGCYSSNNPEVITTHMKQIRDAGIGVIAFSWWGENSFTNQSVFTYLDIAHQLELKLVFHIEPIYETADELKKHLEYITTNYSDHPALFKLNDKPLVYLYDSYKLKYNEWNSILNPESPSTIRNSPLDAIFIGLWTTRFEGEFILKSGFDGFYTYFGSDGFVYGSTTSNWPHLSAFAKENDLIFIPCVGPGYNDTRIRPWNERTTQSRANGAYYESMFMKAIDTDPDMIGITSFNEWHEGTQIEPSVPKKISYYSYEDFGKNTDPWFYIYKTQELISRFTLHRQVEE